MVEILNTIRKYLTLVKVSEHNGIIAVEGIDPFVLKQVLKYLAYTNATYNQIILNTTSSSLYFYSFFALEMKYMLEKALEVIDEWIVSRVLTATLKQLEENTWIRETLNPPKPITDTRYLNELTWTPKPHQREFILEYGRRVPQLNLHGFLLYALPGSGKTFADLALAQCMTPRDLSKVKIIVSPKNAVSLVWKDTIQKIYKRPRKVWTSDSTKKPPELGYEFYVFHYEALDRALELAQRLIQRRTRYFVIIDESHNFNRVQSKRTQALIHLCNMTPWDTYSVFASGTPVKALGTEIVPILRSIDQKFTPEVEARFKKAFSTSIQSALETVAFRFGQITYKAGEVKTTKSPPIIEEIPVTLPNSKIYEAPTIKQKLLNYAKERNLYYITNMYKYKKPYDDCMAIYEKSLKTTQDKNNYKRYLQAVGVLSRDANQGKIKPDFELYRFTVDYENSYILPTLPPEGQKIFKMVKTAVKFYALKVQGEVLGKVATFRSACASDLADHAPLISLVSKAQKKTIIFSNYIDPAERAAQRFEEAGFQPMRIFGKSSGNITQMVDEFTRNPDLNPLCTTFLSLSTAVPVTIANTEIMLDLPFRDYVFQQAVARVSRMGQDSSCYIYKCLLDTGEIENISTRSESIMQWSKEVSSIVVGDSLKDE